MKNFIFPVICILLVSGVATAQDFLKWEIFGGYSLQRTGIPDIDENFSIEELNDLIGDPSVTLSNISTNTFLKKGFSASATFNMNEYFGVEALFQWNKDNIVDMDITVENIDAEGNIKYTDLAFMAGPHFALRQSETITPFAHVLIGIDHGSISVGAEAMGESAEMDLISDNGLGVAFGGGFDVNVTDYLAIRIIQADYFISRHFEETLNNLELAFGAVFLFGGD